MKTLDFQVLEEQEVSKEVPALSAECLFEKEYRELRKQPLNSMLPGCYLAVNFWRNLSNGNYSGLSVGMSGYDFFHPDHIVPTAELISTFMKFADHGCSWKRMLLWFRYSSSTTGLAMQAFRLVMFWAASAFSREA